MRTRFSKVLIGLASGTAVALAGLAGSFMVPLEHEAIQYTARPIDDAVTRLQKQLSSGKVKLAYDEEHGYLKSVLRALDIPVESQVLVFSKTSFQAPRISPRMPRALYYNDHVSVGFVRGGDVLEIAAQDPKQGTVFYTLEQERTSRPQFDRNDTCLQCHQSRATLGVPGLFVSSVYPSSSGAPLFQAGTAFVYQESPISKRWGGWYVSGTHGDMTHRGNAIVPDKLRPDELETEGTQNVTDLSAKFNTGAYLTPHSDIVSLMVLEHQSYMANLITRVGFETRMALAEAAAVNGEASALPDSIQNRINAAAEELVEYMLFRKEAKITAPIRGTSGFAEAFMKAGPRDKRGRSLRDLDMTSRMFRYPCSYLIYSEAFDNMPPVVKDRVLRRLWEVLTGRESGAAFAHLSGDDRKAILEIITDTKQRLPAWWKTAAVGS